MPETQNQNIENADNITNTEGIDAKGLDLISDLDSILLLEEQSEKKINEVKVEIEKELEEKTIDEEILSASLENMKENLVRKSSMSSQKVAAITERADQELEELSSIDLISELEQREKKGKSLTGKESTDELVKFKSEEKKKGKTDEQIQAAVMERNDQIVDEYTTTRVTEITNTYYKDPEIAKQKQESLQKIFEEKGSGSVSDGYVELGNEIAKANGDKEKTAKIKETFTENGFTDKEADNVMDELLKQDSVRAGNEIAILKRDNAIIDSDIKNGTNRFDELLKIRTNAKDDDEAEKKSEEYIQKQMEEDEQFREDLKEAQKLIEKTEETETIFKEIEKKQKAAKLKETAKSPTEISKETTSEPLRLGVNPSTMQTIPPEGVEAVETAVRDGGAKVVSKLFENGNVVEEHAFVGNISGQTVELRFSDAGLYLVGEANDRANVRDYLIDPPTPGGFNGTVIDSINLQNSFMHLANNPAVGRKLAQEFNISDSSEGFAEEDSVKSYRNSMVLLVGEGAPDAGDEKQRLTNLGIIGKGGTVDASQFHRFVVALQKYVPDGITMDEGEGNIGSEESPSFNYSDALTLAAMWKDEKDSFPSLNKLKELTDIREDGGDVTEERFA